MMRRQGLVVATSSLAVVAGLLVGVAPTASAAQPTAAAILSADELGAEAPKRGERVTDLRGGTCVTSVPKGIVRFDGPGGTRLIARVREQGDTVLLSVVSGSGRIGELQIAARDVSGQLAWRGGTMTGSVTINLPGHPMVVRGMSQEVSVSAQPSDCGWAATVGFAATGNGASFDLRGPLTATGSYFLRGAGVVRVGSTKVPVTGFLRATKPGPSATTTWRLAGSIKRPVTVAGARLEQVAVEVVPARRVPRGTATLVLEKPALTAPAILEIGSADTWSARVDGASRPRWFVPGTDRVVVRTSELTGSIGMRSGRPHSTLTAPGQTSIGALDYVVDVGFRGKDTYTVQARSASGTFLSLPGKRAFTGVSTQLTITPRGITGALSVETPGEELLDFPGTWDADNDYVVRPIAGKGWSFLDASLVHKVRSGIGAIRFAGPVKPDGEVDLAATGHIDIHGTRVPVRGYYKRVAWGAGTLPVWALAAYKHEVEGGRITIKGGGGFVGGLIAWEGPGSQHHSTIGKRAPAASAAVQPRAYDITVPPITGSGTTTLELSDADGETFLLPMSYTYVDADNWTATVSASTPSNLYNPFTGLEVPETDFSGTITEAKGVQTWDIAISMQEWQDMAKGIQYKGAFTVSNTCPLTDQSNCPDGEGIFIGGDSTLDFDDPSFPSATSNGAFLTDLSWGWWDAEANGSVSVAGITMANPDITIWRGTGTGPSEDIVLPDLSSDNGNGMNVEFCAAFSVPVPYVSTVNTLGCAAWTDRGVILAQVNTGGSITTTDYNDVNVSSTGLVGYVYNGLPDTETVFLDGTEVDADPNKNYVTADIAIPGNLMRDFGTGSSEDAVITAQGWFDLDGNFSIEGTIPVNLSGGGFTLDEIVITMSRTKDDGLEDFVLKFDAECDVVINGNHFPLDVYIGYQKEGDSTVTVGLSATGTQSTQPEGTMDFVNLVPTGDFEPENATIVDGSFDGKLPANVPNDGGFERSVNPGDVVIDGSFDDSVGLNVITTGDFEEGTFTNILANGDFEDQNFLVNGDFDENGGSTLGWTTTSSAFTTSISSGTASSSTGPTDQGDYVVVLNNNSASKNTTGGLTQTIPVPLNHFGVEVSAWVMSNKTTSAAFHILVTSNGCSSTDSFTSPSVTAVSGSWTEAVASGKLGNGCQSVTVTLVPETSGTSVQIDAVEFAITSTYGGNTVPTVTRPNVVGTFESMATSPLMSGYSSGVSIATDYPGTLSSDGKQSWMTYSSTTGYTPGDFDVSYKVLFPTGSSDREIANFGFWLDGKYSSMTGYFFRLQTSHGDGGFFKRSSSSSWSMVSGAQQVPDVTRGHWYQVRLTAVGSNVTAYVVDLTDGNDVIFSQTLAMPSVPGGVFGQVPDGSSSSTGIRWDDLQINSLQNMPNEQTIVKGPNQVWIADGAHSGNGRASLYTTSQASMPFEYSTGESPQQGDYYTYSTWLRAASGTVSGNISLTALGGTTETVSSSFSVGTTWTQVSTTLAVGQSGHTDLRPRITVKTTNAELQVDDQVLQQVPWYPNTAGGQASSVQVTTDEWHTGSSSLQVTNLANGSSAIYPFAQLPLANSVFTVSAWVLSPGGASGQLTIYEQAGTTSQKFTGTDTWQEVTVTRTMKGGSYLPAITLDVTSGFIGVPVYLDDVSLIVSHIDSTQGAYLGAPPSPGGWTSSVDVLPTTTVSSTQKSKASPTSSAPTAPSSVQASVSGSEVTVSWKASSTPSAFPIQKYKVLTTSGQSVCTNNWNELTFTPPSTSCSFSPAAGTYQFQVEAYNAYGWSLLSSASNSVTVYVSTAPVVLSDSSVAHSGAGTLVLRPGAGGTQIDTYSVTPTTAPAQGSTWQASVWLAPNTANNTKQPVSITFTAGNNTKTTSISLPSTKGSWTNAVVTLPISSAATTFSVAMSYTDSAGTNTVLVDDLSITEINLTPVDDWKTSATSGFVAVQGVDDSTNAYDGDGYLLIGNTGSQSAGVYLDDTYRATSGTAHEFSAWLRAPGASKPVTGYLWVRTFDANGNTLDSYQSAVSVSNKWGYFFMSLPITKTNTATIRTEIDIPAATTFYVDDVESRDVNYWSAVQPSGGVASVTIVDNSGQAANGQNYL
ncbi:MAG: fibronectin type III domain-containing protein, partial [Actinobacteria bacterium]|nr:fibronectin type III domain-containing protein [Actinomycetota bacterium]